MSSPFLPPRSPRRLPAHLGPTPTKGTRRPASTWAAVYAAVGGILVAGYDFLGSIVAQASLSGEPTAHQLRQSDQLFTAMLAAVLLTPVGAGLTHLVVRWAEDRGQSGSAVAVVVMSWPASFVVAWYGIQALPTDARPIGFGVIWAVGGMVLGPALAMVLAYAGSRRSRNARAKA